MTGTVDFGDAQFSATPGLVFHVIEWLHDQLAVTDPLAEELARTDEDNIARLDLRGTRRRRLVNLLADHLAAHAQTVNEIDADLARQLHELGAAARRHRRRQLAIRSGEARCRYQNLPTPTDLSQTVADVDTHATEVEQGLQPDYNQGALPYLRILGWRI
ncbi:hypothetical protein B1R94_27580 [Mycolicibacterium litorale]|nr:hypothetical protein B1R94_27580 [Mycolicibacterium litorale]